MRLLPLVLIFGCLSPVQTDWFVDFETDDLAARAVFTRVAVYNDPGSDPCPDSSRDTPVFEVFVDDEDAVIPELEPDRYCFIVTATDTACTVVGHAMVVEELPINGDLVLVVRAANIPCDGTCGTTGTCTSTAGPCGDGQEYCASADVCCPASVGNACSIAMFTPELCVSPL